MHWRGPSKARAVLGLSSSRASPVDNRAAAIHPSGADSTLERPSEPSKRTKVDENGPLNVESPRTSASNLLPTPAARREERYKIMCCAEGKEPNPEPVARVPSNASSEDLYCVIPPKNDVSVEDGTASLYPDPLQLRKKLVILDLKNKRSTRQALERQRGRHIGNTSETARRSSVGVPAELGAEPGHPPTRSNSCSSLPRYESIINTPVPLRRQPPARPPPPLPRRHRRRGRHASTPLPRIVQQREPPTSRSCTVDVLDFPPEKTPAATKLPAAPTFIGRQSADNALCLGKSTKSRRRVRYAIRASDRTWYEKDQEDTHSEILNLERIKHIVHYFNACAWDRAEDYLAAHLAELDANSQEISVRRVLHLLAVCASFKGEWNEAIKRFIKVLRKPIRSVPSMLDGDCAAAYWLGDLYAMQNRRADALLAYLLAEHGNIFDDATLRGLISAEQLAVQLGVSKAEFKMRWSQDAPDNCLKNANPPSILNTDIVSRETAKACLESGSQVRATRGGAEFAEFLRARHVYALILGGRNENVISQVHKDMAMKIDVNCLDPESPWPMPYDPLFCMPNVQRGRLLAYECDMLEVFKTNPEARLPRPLITKLDCPAYSDLTWLITTIRECLKTYEIEHSEVVNVQGTWFCCRYSFMQQKIATTHYFSIALFKHPFRSGYGVDMCSEDGMCSARIVKMGEYYTNGLHFLTPRGVKKLVRKYLSEAEKGECVKEKGGASSSRLEGFLLPSQYDFT